MDTKAKTSITIDRTLHRRARIFAIERSITLGEVLHRALARFLQQEEKRLGKAERGSDGLDL